MRKKRVGKVGTIALSMTLAVSTLAGCGKKEGDLFFPACLAVASVRDDARRDTAAIL